MKVLMLANHFITLFSFRKELIKKLINDGHEVYLSIPESNENEFFIKTGCKIFPTSIDRRGVNPLKDLQLLKQYKKMMKVIKPDIIFSYTIKPNIYGTMASNKLHIKHICNVTGTGATFLKKSIVSLICKFLYKISIKKCYKVFFQNSGDRDYFINNKIVENNYDLLPGSGCNLDEYPFVDMPSDEIVRFLFVGRVMRLKGIEEYLEAAKSIKRIHPETEFLIAGWNEEEKYKAIVEEYQKQGFVKYIGFRKDISEWIKKSHCTILPSHGGEGVPNVLLESAATGRVCIGSNIPGTSDVIINNESGFLFNAKDTNGLICAINRFLSLSFIEKKQMGIKGRELIEQKFNRNLVIDKYMKELL